MFLGYLLTFSINYYGLSQSLLLLFFFWSILTGECIFNYGLSKWFCFWFFDWGMHFHLELIYMDCLQVLKLSSKRLKYGAKNFVS